MHNFHLSPNKLYFMTIVISFSLLKLLSISVSIGIAGVFMLHYKEMWEKICDRYFTRQQPVANLAPLLQHHPQLCSVHTRVFIWNSVWAKVSHLVTHFWGGCRIRSKKKNKTRKVPNIILYAVHVCKWQDRLPGYIPHMVFRKFDLFSAQA